MSPSVGLFCKSYRADFVPLRQLIESFYAHNPSGLRLTLSLPHEDIAEFHNLFGGNPPYLDVVSDESYAGTDLSCLPGWYAQQVCKLMSWHTVNAEHYLLLDSDCYFIRPVAAEDLRPVYGKRYLTLASRIRTVMKEDNADLLRYIRGQLAASPDWLPRPPETRVDRLNDFVYFRALPQDNPGALERSDIPMKAFGRTEWIYCQPGQIFSSALLRQFIEHLNTHDLTAADAILICPWEYNWYGEFAATFGYADTEFRVSPFLHFQNHSDVDFARHMGITETELSEKFWIVQMAAGHFSELRY